MLTSTNKGSTIYRILNFGTKGWWAHRQLREQGKHIEARRAERRDILGDVDTLRKAQYIVIAHGRWIIIAGRHSQVSGFGGMEYPLVLAAVLLGTPCVDYSEVDRETTIILPVPGPDHPLRTGTIGMLDDVSFDIHAAIARSIGAKLYNIEEARIKRFAICRAGNGWTVTNTGGEINQQELSF
jgi:hypothetical protein